jgi:hypothetical protein
MTDDPNRTNTPPTRRPKLSLRVNGTRLGCAARPTAADALTPGSTPIIGSIGMAIDPTHIGVSSRIAAAPRAMRMGMTAGPALDGADSGDVVMAASSAAFRAMKPDGMAASSAAFRAMKPDGMAASSAAFRAISADDMCDGSEYDAPAAGSCAGSNRDGAGDPAAAHPEPAGAHSKPAAARSDVIVSSDAAAQVELDMCDGSEYDAPHGAASAQPVAIAPGPRLGLAPSRRFGLRVNGTRVATDESSGPTRTGRKPGGAAS